ncbi:hypothetical protein Shyhy01_65320 [Streptomyces hygroscopicus subsp. hygroscopicus]|nr:hypothetical protein [Streptomyces hygroscopicus]GLX53582.1 hypothetical protein Shyhy01_65320 [Streptomyces hygroscopicus subsp. hygroscopicus]
MRTLRINRDLSPLLTGAAAAVATAGALLALAGSESALRGPCALLFLLSAPAAAIATALRGLDPFARTLCALGGAIVVDMLVAQAMLALHLWSVRGGVAAVAVLSLLFLLPALLRNRVRRGSPGPDSE